MYQYPMQQPLPKWAAQDADRRKVCELYEASYQRFREQMANIKFSGEPGALQFKAEILHGLMATYENYRFSEMSRAELLAEYDKAFSCPAFDQSKSLDGQKHILIPLAEKYVDDAIYKSLPLPKRIRLQITEIPGIYKNARAMGI